MGGERNEPREKGFHNFFASEKSITDGQTVGRTVTLSYSLLEMPNRSSLLLRLSLPYPSPRTGDWRFVAFPRTVW